MPPRIGPAAALAALSLLLSVPAHPAEHGAPNGPSRAPTLAAAADAAVKAAAALRALAKGSETTGVAPRQTDPAVARLLDAMLNVDFIAAQHASTPDELAALSRWTFAANEAGVVYVLAGTGLTSFEGTFGPGMAERSGRNVVTYAPEVARWSDAVEILAGDIIDAALAARKGAAAAPQAAKGEAMIRDGTDKIIRGGLTTLPDPGLDDAWRAARLRPLARLAVKASRMLRPDQCTGLRATAADVGKGMTDPAVRDGLKAVTAALAC